MNPAFEKLHRQLGTVTYRVLMATFIFLGLTVACALLGFSQGVISLRGATSSLAYAFGVLFALFIAFSAAAATRRWLDRRQQLKGQI